VFYNHPRLGYCILVNTRTTPGRQAFTLAHEFAHALFHYQEHGLVSRVRDPDRKERFADAFAAHFLVPGQKLRDLVRLRADYIAESPLLEVLQLQRYFRVSYATMLNRLREEGLLPPPLYEKYRGYSPSSLAARFGFDTSDYYPSATTTGAIALSTYPNSVLARTRALVESGKLGPAGAADLLEVSPEEIRDELLAMPAPANTDESREFDELPLPLPPRSRARGR
jgi:hypothetical protein